MSLKDLAKADIEQITSNEDEYEEITFTSPAPGSKVVTIFGIHSVIHFGLDSEGNVINTRKAHGSVSEKFLTDAGYPVRNTKGDVDLKNHKVSVKDSTGTVRHYIMLQFFPNETVGLITFNLETFKP